MLHMLSIDDGAFKVRCWEAGSGRALLFLHGIDGFTPDAEFLHLLAGNRRVIAPETPGFGESTDLDRIDDMLDATVYHQQLLEALGLDQVDVAGHSLGAMLAAELAAVSPQSVRRLVLVSPLGLWLDDSPLPDFFTISDREMARSGWANPDLRPGRPDPSAPPPDPKAVQATTIERTKNLAAAGKFLWPIPDRGLSKRVSRIKAPTLIVRGEEDRLVPAVYANAFQAQIRNSHIATLPDAGHYPMVEQPEAFAQLVGEFLDG